MGRTSEGKRKIGKSFDRDKIKARHSGSGETDLFLTVGIGASAGGLEAFKSFFSRMPADTGMAFVLVQHLSPDHKSMLAELLGKTAKMEVIEATDGVKVRPDCVFVIPPDSTMTIGDGRLKIVRPAPPRDQRRPIDTFFHSLAEDKGERAICIILAGTGSDGSQGLSAVKDHGGLTLAQAEYDSHVLPGMPQSAENTGLVDEVLEVEAMPARLISYQKHMAKVARGKDDEGVRTDAGSDLSAILRALHARSRHDFSEYKQKTLMRRLQRRMQVLQVETPGAYREKIAENPEELDALLRELLINVTGFFRDPASFEALNNSILKNLVAGKGADDEIRVWVAGCATGEEAYSIAILLREAMEARGRRPKVCVFATDLDEHAIAAARLGRYRSPVVGLTCERAERWFTTEGENLCVVPEIREMCVFSVHSIIKHPPFSKLDLISCRNLLIYLDSPMQERVMRMFHYGLKPGGHLFLGSSESVTRATKLFSATDKKHRLFKRRDGPNGLPPAFSADRGTQPGASDARAAPRPDSIGKHMRRIMENHYPPHVVIDLNNQIVRFSGGPIGQYLEPAPGAPSFTLFDMLRKTLRPSARDIVQEARTAQGPVRRAGLPLRIDGKPRLVDLTAERLAPDGPDAEFIVLALHDAGAAEPRRRDGGADRASNEAAQALEHELRTTRTQLQSTIDELETANEEMKSANEEYQSVNEELQSSNEELETAKEEMQSVNEELQTINTEIASKNEQLTQLNSDLSNLLESTDIATLFLDESCRVRRFTRGVSDVFHLRETDIGRPITEIVSLLDYKELQHDVKAVLRKLTQIEREVTLQSGKAVFMLRMRPYRTVDNVITGVVLTFIDITERKYADEAVRASEAKYRMLFDYIDEGFCTLEKVEVPAGEPSDYRYLTANPGFAEQSGVKGVVGKTIRQVVPGESEEWFDIYDTVMATGEPVRFERELVTRGRMLEAFAFRFDDGAAPKLGVIFLDVSHRRRHEEQQDLLLREMDHRVKNLFSVIGGVVSLSSRSASTPQEMAAAIQGRLSALAGAHQLVRPHRSGGAGLEQLETTLAKILQTVLEPYAEAGDAGGESRARIEGPDVAVGGAAVTSMAMILHELATNAAKYGALSEAAGAVHVSWTLENKRLELVWTERGGPKLDGAPEREGFGGVLARSSIKGQLDGQLSYDWHRDGLTVRLSASAERLVS